MDTILQAPPPIKVEERGFIVLKEIKHRRLQCTWEPGINLQSVKTIHALDRNYEIMHILAHSDKHTIVDVLETILEPPPNEAA